MMTDRLINDYLPADYEDTYSRDLRGGDALTPEELFNTMLTRLPWWIDRLMKLRNILVRPLGLKGGEFEKHLSEMIQCRNERELVWGMNDKHLRFHASMWCCEKEDDKQTVGITTIVKYNNSQGKAYFFIIKPFHKLIIRSLLKKI